MVVNNLTVINSKVYVIYFPFYAQEESYSCIKNVLTLGSVTKCKAGYTYIFMKFIYLHEQNRAFKI